MASGFISADDFHVQVQTQKEEQKIFTWAELPADGKIFRIIKTEKIKTKYGESSICFIEDINGVPWRVWAPAKLIRDFDGKKEGSIAYFTSLGQVERDNKTYNNYDLVIREE